jgi:hypothetical protein
MGMSPLAMRCPPNHMIATMERFMISMSAGIMRAMIRFTDSAVDVRSAFASSKRLRS